MSNKISVAEQAVTRTKGGVPLLRGGLCWLPLPARRGRPGPAVCGPGTWDGRHHGPAVRLRRAVRRRRDGRAGVRLPRLGGQRQPATPGHRHRRPARRLARGPAAASATELAQAGRGRDPGCRPRGQGSLAVPGADRRRAGQTALFTGPEVKEALEAKGLAGSLWRNEFAPRVVERAPHAELRRYPASHFEIYHGQVFQRVLADQVDFLKRHLLSEAAGRKGTGDAAATGNRRGSEPVSQMEK